MGTLLEIKIFLELIREGKPELTKINCEENVEKAIGLMLNKEYSQLPVMKGDKMVGVISHESVAKTLFSFIETKSKPPSKVRVKHCMERVSEVFSIEDDLFSLLNTLAERSFVFVSKRSIVTDIITSYDALRFFRACGEDFLVLNDIENIMRKIIADKFDASSFARSQNPA